MSICSYGRQIIDVALMANKVANELLFQNRLGVLCKLNMEKVHDLVHWDLSNTC